ncbi:ABC transporter substrate-binding protein [Reyranella sp.]|uniref:ABC transporter substrate-binding protein n=1 Tax=Reyranella sp. TaxID=1929291 RepID=UPI003BAAD24F
MTSKRLFGRRTVMAGAAATAGITIWSQRLSAQSGEVAVGAMVPITGPFNVSGQQYHYSLQMAQDEINAKGGVAGKKLKIVFEDVKDSNSVAVNAYLKVVRDINPPLVFLSSYTTQNLATEPEVTKAQIPGFYAGGGDAMHKKKNPWLFRIRPADGIQALALAKHATQGLGKKKIGIIYVQNDFGQPGAVAAEKIVKDSGAEVVGMEAYAFTDNDMSAQLQKLKNAGADCLICISYGKDGALILKLLKEMGIDIPVVISSGVMVPAARNLIAPDELAKVNGVMDAYLSSDRGPEVATYIKSFKDRFKLEPDPFGSCYYDAAWIMKQVMDKVGTDRAKVRDGIKAIKGYKGVTNTFTTDEDGNMVHSLAVFSIKPGTRDPVFIRTIEA